MKRSKVIKMLAIVSMVAVTVSFTGEHALAVSEGTLAIENESLQTQEAETLSENGEGETSGGNAENGQSPDEETNGRESGEESGNAGDTAEAENSDLNGENAEKMEEGSNAEESSNESAEDQATEEQDPLAENEVNPAVSDGDAAAADETSEDKEPLVSGAFHYETEADGYRFVFSAEENVVPDGTKAEVKLVQADENIVNEIDRAATGEAIIADVFDIRLFDKDGTEIQPEEGSVHISLKLSEGAMIRQEEYEGCADLKMIHIHDEESKQLDNEETKENSGVEIPSDTDVETYVSEDMIDPDTQTLKDNVLPQTVVLGASKDKEYYQNITLDFDTDSFSVFALVNVLQKYEFDPVTTVDGDVSTIDLTSMKADLESDFYRVVQDALGKAWAVTKTDRTKFYKIIVPAGTYYQYSDDKASLRLGNNTTLILNGVTIINQRDGLMFTTRKLENAEIKGKYDDYCNIAINGGTLVANSACVEHSMVKLAHITGLEISGVTFQGGASPHMLEIAACKDVKVKNCTFKDTLHGDNELEAFQIDVQTEGMMTYDVDPANDDYPCTNVEVSGCIFSNLYRGFGSHGAIAGPFYYTNINVNNCTFDNIINTAIMCTMWKDSNIANNVITNVGRGIDTTTYSWYTNYPTDEDDNPGSLSYNSNTTISGNQISIGGADRNSGIWAGILLSGYYSATAGENYPAGLYPVSGFTVTGNTISGYKDWNYFKQDDIFADIYTLYAKGVNINDNTLTDNWYGIQVQGGGEASMLSSNHFGSEKYASIAVKNGGNVQNMSGNKLTMDCPFGIYVDDESICNGTCETNAYVMGAGESKSVRTGAFSLFTNDCSNQIAGTYKSSKKSVAKVTQSGKIKGIKKGKATVTASWDRGGGVVNVVLTANIKKAPSKVKLAKKKTLKKGKTYQLNPKVNKGSHCEKYKYKSSNKKIAKVSSTGLVTARKKGKAIITVKAYNGVSTTILINVK
ncbi:Ig-like domain (group 2) [Butyrivibrio sp. ob235]|uniref:Ig-like domain-containing protein n=1 Tax=Butyrivibrio sp. ob235 TaxID=1761780 RepID=UPI0008C48264|nr:Ig-like domain-containing protein [Butyrivibrio sp. ob235]SEL81513.1 Ig-like domain (group 2) [Butyrivibrio sp. ob235]